jgi:uncharacterized protein (TIGR00251 family)
MNVRQTKEGVILELFVKPRSKEFGITVEENGVVVHCREEPVKGRVNKELIKEFSRILNKKVELVSGFTSKRKRLLVRNAEKSELEQILQRIARN